MSLVACPPSLRSGVGRRAREDLAASEPPERERDGGSLDAPATEGDVAVRGDGPEVTLGILDVEDVGVAVREENASLPFRLP